MLNFCTIVAGAAVLAAQVVRADDCASGSQEIDGNWYCQAVDSIQYTGFSGAGTYNKVTAMDSTTGTCSSSAFAYSGGLAPLDEGVSIHFRGPIQLKQFAVYTPSSSSSKNKRSPIARRHARGHAHFHEHNKEIREVQEEAELEAPVEKRQGFGGPFQSWASKYGFGSASSAAAASVAETTSTIRVATSTVYVSGAVSSGASTATAVAASSVLATSAATSAAAAATSSTVVVSGSSWVRSAYYNAASASSSGLTFLNNFGGVTSGVWDAAFGNSLSYASSDMTTGVASAQVLNDMTVPSNTEFSIFTDTVCTTALCGFSRTGTVAYNGFVGAQKAFLFEFSMPLDGVTSGNNPDMPAIWMLNAQIPRTLQYGAASCSCWTTGCGEFDIFEVLTQGSLRAKSTLHGNLAGGDSDYFVRPTGSTIKLAAIMSGETITLQLLDDDYDFASSLDATAIASLESLSSAIGLTSTFALS